MSEGPFLPPREFQRLFRLARLARVEELASLGIARKYAEAQANSEFQAYDLLDLDERGWMRMHGLDLSPSEPVRRQPNRGRQARRPPALPRRRR